jgi:hypothetical protein
MAILGKSFDGAEFQQVLYDEAVGFALLIVCPVILLFAFLCACPHLCEGVNACFSSCVRLFSSSKEERPLMSEA